MRRTGAVGRRPSVPVLAPPEADPARDEQDDEDNDQNPCPGRHDVHLALSDYPACIPRCETLTPDTTYRAAGTRQVVSSLYRLQT